MHLVLFDFCKLLPLVKLDIVLTLSIDNFTGSFVQKECSTGLGNKFLPRAT